MHFFWGLFLGGGLGFFEKVAIFGRGWAGARRGAGEGGAGRGMGGTGGRRGGALSILCMSDRGAFFEGHIFEGRFFEGRFFGGSFT